MNKYIIFAFLLICQNLFAQEEDKKAGTQAYKEFNEWLNDTIPTITDQYSLTYNHDLEQYEELNVRILVNAEVKNGKMTILNSTSRKHNLDYVMNLIKNLIFIIHLEFDLCHLNFLIFIIHWNIFTIISLY